jgi:hypothetical protein
MRSQSSIEFLTTYSFLFLILGVVISVIMFLSTSTASILPQQCSSFGGPNCNFISMYSSKAGGYSTLTFSITNSQSVPINITSLSTTIKSASSLGSCTPAFLYPGQQATCTTSMSIAYNIGTLIQGFYSLNAQYCNAGIAGLARANCTYETVSYGGAFSVTPFSSRAVVYSVIASQGSKTLQLLPYNAMKISTGNMLSLQPNNYTVLQNGDWVNSTSSAGAAGYAYATNGLIGQTYVGSKFGPYPSSTSSLSNNNIACSNPYNSMLSIASTTLYMNTASTITVNAVTSGAMEVFYKQAGPGIPWQSVFAGTAWKTQTATQYSGTINVNKAVYNFQVVWSNPCGGGGQLFKLSGLPA